MRIANTILAILFAFSIFYIPNKYKGIINTHESVINTQNEVINNQEKVNEKAKEDNVKINKELDKLSNDLASVNENLEKANELVESNKADYEKTLGEKDIKISQLERRARPQAPNRGGSKGSTKPEQSDSKSSNTKSSNLGTFNSTAYCSCSICCGPNAKGITASGTRVQAGRTIAVDPKVIPLGSKVLVNGKQYIAEDTGGAIKGKIIDVYFNSHSEAQAWGRRNVSVELVQ